MHFPRQGKLRKVEDCFFEKCYRKRTPSATSVNEIALDSAAFTRLKCFRAPVLNKEPLLQSCTSVTHPLPESVNLCISNK